MACASPIVLDGGLGRELLRINAPFKQPEWSALALYEAPDLVAKAHRNFIDAGAEVITTNSYALVPFHIGEERFRRDASRLVRLASSLARKEADSSDHSVLVAGSIPPALGSYRPDIFDRARAQEIHTVLVEGQAGYVDFWLAETISSIPEAAAINDLLTTTSLPKWFSFTLEDENVVRPTLRSGEGVESAVDFAAKAGAERLLFNCSHPEVMLEALTIAQAAIKGLGTSLKLGVYANAFTGNDVRSAANAGISGIRGDLDPSTYAQLASEWLDAGATAIGGCCGITPDHISQLRQVLKP